MKDIPEYHTFIKVEPVHKGWSTDEKFYVETADGRRLLLRLANIAEYDRKKAEFEGMERVAALGVPMSQPVRFGTCNGGQSMYSLLTWCDGEDAGDALSLLSDTEQYILGVKSGEILRKIHAIPAPESLADWAERFGRKTDNKIERYHACGLRFPGDDAVIAYLDQNRELLNGRPQCYQHGDYHVGNMIVSPDNELLIIDWNRSDYGDPWEEFNRIVWSAAVSPPFATGQLDGYFGGKPPLLFFKLLAFYIAGNTLSSVSWAISFGQSDVDTMMRQAADVLLWFDGMKNPVPSWYIENLCIQHIDGIPFRLGAPFDMSFISRYGTVFKVFGDQDSGNICFGVQNASEKLFIKFAGAPTGRMVCTREEAVANLKAAVPVYRDLAHKHLIRLIADQEVGGGYAAVFAWSDSECMGRMYPKSRKAFMRMPLSVRMQVFEDILAFHAHVIACGYVAIDFYDGSILYDFQKGQTVICDIDFYTKRPYVNRMGRLWGSTRFMSPEEFTLGADIDEVTNVYVMGATAFALFSEYDRTPEKWPLSQALFAVVSKAVSDERGQRQQSMNQLIREWTDAKG